MKPVPFKKPSAVFLDREGVITPALPLGMYVTRSEHAILAPGVPEALRLLVKANIPLFIASNQSCVSRGLVTLKEAMRLHELILDKLFIAGVPIVDTLLCPHADRDRCVCRKPLPGLFVELSRLYEIDLATSATIGDTRRDMQATRAAGIPIRISVGEVCSEATDCVPDLLAACKLLRSF